MRRIPLYKAYWDNQDVEAVTKVVKRGTYWAEGPEIEQFEKSVADYLGSKYAVAFNSGTSALHALMLAYRLNEDDEVIVPSFTFIATANAPLLVRAKPVFADIEEETFGLDAKSVTDRITRKTKAVIPVHYGGLPCKHIKEMIGIAEDRGLILIEDAAESIGANIEGKKVGTFGEAAMISFCGNKVMTTGEGGIAVVDSKKIHERLKLARSHGRSENGNYFSSSTTPDYVELGYNWRMATIAASLGLSQMKKLDKVIQMRRDRSRYMASKLSKISQIVIPKPPSGYHHVYQMFTIRISGGRKLRDALRSFLNTKGVMTKIYFEPIHLTQFYRRSFGFEKGMLPMTERLSEEVLTLPLYPAMKQAEMNHVIECTREFFERQH